MLVIDRVYIQLHEHLNNIPVIYDKIIINRVTHRSRALLVKNYYNNTEK